MEVCLHERRTEAVCVTIVKPKLNLKSGESVELGLLDFVLNIVCCVCRAYDLVDLRTNNLSAFSACKLDHFIVHLNSHWLVGVLVMQIILETG